LALLKEYDCVFSRILGLTLLHGYEWSSSNSDRFSVGKAEIAHPLRKVWIGFRDALEAMEKEKYPSLLQPET